MRAKVPQSIDLEEKVIGRLTVKQFMYLLGGALFGYLVYKSYDVGALNVYLAFTIIAFIALAALAFAFARPNQQPFEVFLGDLFLFLFTPKRRLWSKDAVGHGVTVKIKEEGAEKKKPATVKQVTPDRLKALAAILDERGFEVGEESRRGHLENVDAQIKNGERAGFVPEEKSADNKEGDKEQNGQK